MTSCGLVHCPGGNATVPIWRVLTSSLGIFSWTPLKPQSNNPNLNPLANQLCCIDFLNPPTPLIIPHRLPPCLLWISYATCAFWESPSLYDHIYFVLSFFLVQGAIGLDFFLNMFIWHKDGILTSTITQSQSGAGSNGNGNVLHTSQISRTGASLPEAI